MLPDAAVAHYNHQVRLSAAAVATARTSWARINVNTLDRSWQATRARLFVLVVAMQRSAAQDAITYVPDVLAELDLHAPPAGRPDPRAFAGIASDGRDLDTLLDGAIVHTKEALGLGASTREAFNIGRNALDRIVTTQIADAGRGAAAVAIAARPAITGYVRMLSVPSCSRCAVLAGKWFGWNTGFTRHPRCFPAGVVVSGPATEAATRRRYQGELVVIRTASGQELPTTGNHPILTDRGWVPAHLLEEGDHVVRSLGGQSALPLVIPHEHQMPARIEDLRGPNRMVSLGQVPTAPEDFHGDGSDGYVDVVLADRLLRDRGEAPAIQLTEEEYLPRRVAETPILTESSAALKQLERLVGTSDGDVRGGSLCAALIGGHVESSDLPGCRQASDLDAGLVEVAANHSTRHSVLGGQPHLALAGPVGGGQVIDRQHDLAPRWDAPAGPLTMESRAGYADRGEDLRLRLAGQVALDRVVELRRIEWSGHVFNLTSAEGWYAANGLIVSNCDCRHIPATENLAGELTTDTKAAIASGQITGLTKADTAAIDRGADIGQVINAHRGMRTASRPGVGRVTPEDITTQVATRERAITELRRHRYLV